MVLHSLLIVKSVLPALISYNSAFESNSFASAEWLRNSFILKFCFVVDTE